MAVKKQTSKKHAAAPSRAARMWNGFRRSALGRAMILLVLAAALIALFAWVSGTNLPLFLMLGGVFFLLMMVIAWFMYLTLREANKPSAGARTKKRA